MEDSGGILALAATAAAFGAVHTAAGQNSFAHCRQNG